MSILKVLKNIFFPNYSKILSDGMKDAEINKGNPNYYLQTGKYLIYFGLFFTFMSFIFYKFSTDDLGIMIYLMYTLSIFFLTYGIYMVFFKERFATKNKNTSKHQLNLYSKYLLPIFPFLFIYGILTDEINKIINPIYILSILVIYLIFVKVKLSKK